MLERLSSTSRYIAERGNASARYLGLVVAAQAAHVLGSQLRASIGALMCIGLTGLISAGAFGTDPHLPLIVAPMGASAVLLFAAPASPFAQPWPIIGGNTISVLVGIAVGQAIHEPVLAIGVAVGLAIVVMSLARCLHPPGGAAALTAIIGGPAVITAGFSFAFVPVCLNAVLLVFLGAIYHRISGLSYPHAQPCGPSNPSNGVLPTSVESHQTVRDTGPGAFRETLDSGKRNLARLSPRAGTRACPPLAKVLSCIDVASKNIFSIAATVSIEAARALLLDKGVARLVVVDPYGHPIGTLGWAELSRDAECMAEVMAKPSLMKPDASLSDFIDAFSVGAIKTIVIIDDRNQVLGLVTPIDLLKGISSSLCPYQSIDAKMASIG